MAKPSFFDAEFFPTPHAVIARMLARVPKELWECRRRVADSWEHGTAWTGRAIAIED